MEEEGKIEGAQLRRIQEDSAHKEDHLQKK
jgi:hypothetical protein